MRPAEFFAADPDFGHTLAVFLRQHPDRWRLRRVDRFTPHDLYLAKRETSWHCRLDPALVTHFLETAGSELKIAYPAVLSGDDMTAYIPFSSQPKRLLLNHTLTDGRGRRLEMLNRYQDSWIEALHLLSYAKRNKTLTEHEEFAALLLLATLVFQNPQSLAERIARWAATHPGTTFSVGAPLTGEALRTWIADEAQFFLPKQWFGEVLSKRLEFNFDDFFASPLRIDQTGEPRSHLDHFLTLPVLALHAIRDFLKVLIDVAPEWPPKDGQPTAHVEDRAYLLAHRRVLLKHANELFIEGISVLEDLLGEDYAHSVAARAINDSLDQWCAVVQVHLELGAPFVLQTSETFPLDTWERRTPARTLRRQAEEWWRSSFGTGHFYPLALKQAQSVHLEIEVPHPELWAPQLDGRTPTLMERTFRSAISAAVRAYRWTLPKLGRDLYPQDDRRHVQLLARYVPTNQKDGGEEDGTLEKAIPFEFAFGGYTQPSDRLLHFYSSRQLHESADRDFVNRYLELFIPLRFKFSVLFGYLSTILAYILATSLVLGSFIPAMIHHHRPALLTETIAAGGLAVTLSLWLLGHVAQEPIVNQKLALIRQVLFACVSTILATFVIFGSYFILHGLSLPDTGRATQRHRLHHHRQPERTAHTVAKLNREP